MATIIAAGHPQAQIRSGSTKEDQSPHISIGRLTARSRSDSESEWDHLASDSESFNLNWQSAYHDHSIESLESIHVPRPLRHCHWHRDASDRDAEALSRRAARRGRPRNERVGTSTHKDGTSCAGSLAGSRPLTVRPPPAAVRPRRHPRGHESESVAKQPGAGGCQAQPRLKCPVPVPV
jgi:hypothetical protein